MKKIITMIMTLALLLCVSACGNNTNKELNVETDTIMIQALNENSEKVELEVPYKPQRIAILDMPALDIIDALGVGEYIVGSASVSIEYLAEYDPTTNDTIMNLGTVKTADLESVAACNPDIIFIGGRLSAMYQELEAIAPVVYLAVDYEKGIVESTKANAQTIASIFGKENEVEALFNGFQPRIDTLNEVLKDKDVLLGMYNANALALMGTNSQLNMIVKELGANNLSEKVKNEDNATHGEEASWETIMQLNPEYMFILDRSRATQANDKNVMGVQEVIENDLMKELDVYKNKKIIYFIEHANVWYTSTGGVQALDTMLSDLEDALLN